MIIKIIPENDFEKQRIQEEEHTGVKEFFMFGNKKDKEGDLIDFHNWTGSYRYLEGSIYHFLTTITEEKISKSHRTNEIDLRPQGQIKPPFIKRGQIDDGNVKIINVEELSKKDEPKSSVIPFSPIQVETPVQNAQDKNIEAEDNNLK